jgi:hypothetical protein
VVQFHRPTHPGIFHRGAIFSRRTSALLHLTILSPESNGQRRSILSGSKTGPAAPTRTLSASRIGDQMKRLPSDSLITAIRVG